VLLFGRLLDHLPRPLAIESVRTGFPDCRATDSATGETICIEFELKASHYFRDHLRREERCDWIVCWNDDLGPGAPASPCIVALDAIVDAGAPSLILNRLPLVATPLDAFLFRLSGLPPSQQQLIRGLLAFGGSPGFSTEWPETNGATFTVRGQVAGVPHLECFKVSSTGSISVAISRWKGVPQPTKSELASRLNEAVGSGFFSGTGKMARDIQEVFRTESSLDRFTAVWQSVRAYSPESRTPDGSADTGSE
jgi:hypothetical protein